MKNGWIKLDRNYFDHPLFEGEEFTRSTAFLWLITKAAYADYEKFINGFPVILEPGQLAITQSQLSEAWRWSRQSVRTFLQHLERCKMIKRTTNQGITTITICNYTKFQNKKPSSNQRATKEQPKSNQAATKQQPSSNHPYKKVKKVKKDKKSDVRFEAFWEAFDDKRGREPAFKSWEKINPDSELADKIIAGAEAYANWRKTIKPKDQTGKMAQGWLTDRRWEDDLSGVAKPRHAEREEDWENVREVF